MNPHFGAFETLLSVANQGTSILLTWSWQALVLLACVAVVLKLLRLPSSALRHHVWLLGLLMVALLPFGAKVASALPASTNQKWSHAWSGQPLRYVTEFPGLVLTPLPRQAQPLPGPAHSSLSKSPAKPNFSFGALVFCIWLAGACLTLVNLLHNLWRIRGIRSHGVTVRAAALGCAARLDQTIPLKLSVAVQSPVLLGVLRPQILLPHDFTEWTTVTEREAMIEHELAHVARRDHYTNLLLNSLNVIFYFHPLVRYASNQIKVEREIACDDCVVNAGADAAAYAESILKAAERCLGRPALTTLRQPAFFTSKQTLERRIEMILNQDRMRVLTKQWKYLLLPIVAIALLGWLLIPTPVGKSGLAQTIERDSNSNSTTSEELLTTALQGTEIETRLNAAIRLMELNDVMSKDAVVTLYNRSNDPQIKELIIRDFGKRHDLQHLADIARRDASPQYRGLAKQALETLKATFDTCAAQDQRKLPPPPPPPPPPSSSMLTVEAGKPLTSLPGYPDDFSAFAVLRQLAEAHIRRDTTVFERLLADDYVGYGPNGESFNKAEELAEVKKLDYTVTKFEFDDLRLSGNEGMSVASFLGTVYYQANGQAATVQYRYTATMVRRNPGGPLRVVSIHMSRKV